MKNNEENNKQYRNIIKSKKIWNQVKKNKWSTEEELAHAFRCYAENLFCFFSTPIDTDELEKALIKDDLNKLRSIKNG